MSDYITDDDLLPLWKTIKQSYITYFSNFSDILRVSWLWIALFVGLGATGSWLIWSWVEEVRAAPADGNAAFETGMLMLAQLPVHASSFIAILAGIGIAVAWHRRVILGERPALSGSNIVTKNFWSFALTYVAVALAVMAVVLVLAFVVWVSTTIVGIVVPFLVAPLGVIGGVAVAVIAVAMILRLSLLLPARAIGDNTLTFGEAWRGTRHNTWRLLGGMIACTLPVILLSPLSLLLDRNDVFRSGELGVGFFYLMAGAIIGGVINLLAIPIFVGFLSHAYQFFFEGVRSPH